MTLRSSLDDVISSNKQWNEIRNHNLRDSITASLIASNSTTIMPQVNDLEYIKKMTALREETLIKKGFIYFLMPSLAIGITGIFIPFIYILVPLHESGICLCAFF